MHDERDCRPSTVLQRTATDGGADVRFRAFKLTVALLLLSSVVRRRRLLVGAVSRGK